MQEKIKKRPINIYALVNPTNNSVFYVGATSSPLVVRLSAHCSEITGNNKSKIISEIIKFGSKPKIVMLEKDVPLKSVSSKENFYIRKYGLLQLKSTYSKSYKGRKFICQDDNTVSVWLGELSSIYREEAARQERSMHWLILSVLKKSPFAITALEELKKKSKS